MSMCAAAASLTSPPEGNIGRVLENTAVAFIIVLSALVTLRYCARYTAKTPWGWEDFLVPFAYLANIGICVISIGRSIGYLGS